MAEFHVKKVTVAIDKTSDLFKKIGNIAEQMGQTVDQVTESLAVNGIYHHMLGNAILLQRALQDQGKEEE